MYLFLFILASASVLFPLAIGTWKYKYLQTDGKILYGYLWLSLLIGEIAMWYTSINRIQNHFLSNIFIPLEFILLGYIYWITLISTNFKRIILIVGSCILLFQIASNWVYFSNFNRFNSVANALANLGLMFFVILYFYELLKYLNIVKLTQSSMFWISVGTLLYVSISFFLFIFGEFVMFNSSPEISKLWTIIQPISSFIFRIFIAIGLWFSTTHQQLNPSSK